jgi:hypothetical protein
MHSDKGHSAFGDCKYDAILVLGGGIKSNRDLPLWVKLRLNRVLEYGMNIPVLTLSAAISKRRNLTSGL